MKLHTINTGLFKLDGGAMFGVVPKSMWSKQYEADSNNMCTWAMRCMLIEDGSKLTLIDTGIGNKQDDKFFSHFYLHGDDTLEKSLNQKGFTTNDITDVFLTHLHFDHCGGAIKQVGEKYVPTFAKANYWSNEAHWENATMPNDREKASFLSENILPIKESGQLLFVESMGLHFNNHMQIKIVNGHTDAMMLPLIEYKGHKILYCADLFPSHLHVPIPWVMAYDMQPLLTLKEKKDILHQAIAHNWLLYFEHDEKVECASLVQTERGIKVGDKIQIADL